MTSPDVTPYVDLTLLDLDPQAILESAIAIAQTRFPEWVPLEGNVEVVLLEALSEVVAELVYAINRLPSSTLEVLLRLFGLTRDPGLFPTVNVTFTTSDAGGYTIPQGTVVRLDLATGLDPLLFATDVDLPIAAGSTSGTVSATGTERTSDGNGTASGTALVVVSSVQAVDSAVTASAVANGLSAESGYDFLIRARLRLQQISTTLVLAAQFEAAAAEHAGVIRVRAVDNWDASTNASSTNHITVAVLGSAGATLSTTVKNDILSDLTARAIAGMAVHVVDVTTNSVAVAVEVVRLAGYTDAQVTSNVQAAIQAYLNPDTWPIAGKVYVNEIISVVDRAPGVDRVVGTPTLNTVAADLTLTGLVPLPVPSTPTVTVDPPA